MRNITVTFADGTSHTYQNAPNNVTPDQVQARAEKEFAKTVKSLDGGKQLASERPTPTVGQDIKQGAGNLLAGAVRGAGSIGATLLYPLDAAARTLGVQNDYIGRTDRRESMDQALAGLGAETDSLTYGAGKLGAEIAGTAGAGGLLAKGISAIPGATRVAAPLIESIKSSGMSAGGLTGATGLAARAAGGAITGGASAGIVDPSTAVTGALIGGGAPLALKGIGTVAEKIGSKVAKTMKAEVSPEVATLANRAKDLGIDIPADRLVDSRPLNALAAGLNYVPFSGRAEAEDLMTSQLNKAVSKTFGQDSSNVTMALRKANDKLGGQFEHTLRNNGLKIDPQFMEDLAGVYNKAESELGSDALKPIATKIDDLLVKGKDGVINGQAAYNIKRDLDRIGRQNTPTAFHALELKGKLMEALDRSLGAEQAAAFAKTRKEYGNMLALEKLAKNGVEGEISAARLANMKNINNAELQELADISAQFIKPREGQHGAAQRALVGIGAGSMGGVPALAAGAAAGRIGNAALNSQRLKDMMLGNKAAPSKAGELMKNPDLRKLLLRAAPVVAAQ